MKEILKKKEERKKQLESDLPILRKLQKYCTNDDKTWKEIKKELDMNQSEIEDIFIRNNFKVSVYNEKPQWNQALKLYSLENLEKEHENISEYLKENSFMEKYGRQIIIGIIIAIAAFLLGKLS